MKALLMTLALMGNISLTHAQQTVAGTTYYLPKTALRVTMLIEKTTYTPGQFAMYANRYMRKPNVAQTSTATYRIADIRMAAVGVPDSAKQRTLVIDKKYSVNEVDRDESGILLAINTTGKRTAQPKAFVPSAQPAAINPKDFMNEDILSAGSTAKMAELTAKEIYDIRESRAQLSRGQADFMPKDGAQLKIMMENLDKQEHALLQVFEGVTTRDTVETVITCVPTEETDRQLLFRFSRKLGLVDNDDLAGTPYYISVAIDRHVTDEAPAASEKEPKDNFGLYVNVPEKIQVTLSHQGKAVKRFETYAGQFGKTECLSGELFGKKLTSRIVLNPVSGSIEKIESDMVK